MRVRLFPHLPGLAAWLLFSLPLGLGLLGMVLLSCGWTGGVAGVAQLSFDGWRQLFAWPPLLHSLALSAFVGLVSTLLSGGLAFVILARFHGTALWRRGEALLAPLAALPHVAFAGGLFFLLAPGGWLFRLLELCGLHWQALLVRDPGALGMTLALALRETPFLLLMSLGLFAQFPLARLQAVSAGLGYDRGVTALKILLPLWLRAMRLPLAAVLCYGVSVVDVAVILAPRSPAPFALQLWLWLGQGDPALLPRVAAGGMVLTALCLLLAGVLRLLERAVCSSPLLVAGGRHWPVVERLGEVALLLVAVVSTLCVALVAVWSLAFRWRFPQLLPSEWSLHFWAQQWQAVVSLAGESLALAFVSTSIALAGALACHSLRERGWPVPVVWLILPLVLPALPLLFGLQSFLLLLPQPGLSVAMSAAVAWGHLLFVFPYVYFTLDGPWRAFDARYERAAASLGAGPVRRFWRVRLPLLLPAVAFSFAVGMSVSLAQYLPTLMLGGGQIATITTEAVAVTSGGDRRLMAVFGLVQGVLPLLFFLLPLLLRKREGRG